MPQQIWPAGAGNRIRTSPLCVLKCERCAQSTVSRERCFFLTFFFVFFFLAGLADRRRQQGGGQLQVSPVSDSPLSLTHLLLGLSLSLSLSLTGAVPGRCSGRVPPPGHRDGGRGQLGAGGWAAPPGSGICRVRLRACLRVGTPGARAAVHAVSRYWMQALLYPSGKKVSNGGSAAPKGADARR